MVYQFLKLTSRRSYCVDGKADDGRERPESVERCRYDPRCKAPFRTQNACPRADPGVQRRPEGRKRRDPLGAEAREPIDVNGAEELNSIVARVFQAGGVMLTRVWGL